jgi:hypothetical protein
MEEELDLNEEQSEEVVGDVVPTDDVAPSDNIASSTNDLDENTPTSVIDEYSVPSEDTTVYAGDEETTTTKPSEEVSSDDKWGSCDCRSECKYNTGDSSKYANYGYSD